MHKLFQLVGEVTLLVGLLRTQSHTLNPIRSAGVSQTGHRPVLKEDGKILSGEESIRGHVCHFHGRLLTYIPFSYFLYADLIN